MDLGLEGKRAIVTGGSLGIGKAIARELAREGADVAIVARTKETLEAAARELAAETKRRVIPLVADVTSRAQVDAMVAQAATQLGGLHILVNSGSPPGGSAHRHRPHRDHRGRGPAPGLHVKYVGALRCARARHPLPEGQDGAAHQISGPMRGRGQPHRRRRATPPSCTSPRRWPCMSAASGSPSTVSTPASRARSARRASSPPAKELGIAAAAVEKADFAHDSPRGNAIGRMVDAVEIAYVTAFLASDKAWAISGELIVATGGAGRSVYY